MGNDGGSIPTRRELVKSAARAPTVSELKATALEAMSHAWATDPVSGEALDLGSVVSDWRGRMYNYETILHGLMPGGGGGGADGDETTAAGANATGEGELTFAATGISSLRDIVRLQGKSIKRVLDKSGAAGSETIWRCPVTLKELGPAAGAVYVVPCGHVFSEAAVETISADQLCPECSEPFQKANIIPVLPTDKTELARLRQRLDTLRADGLTHSLKKDKSAHSSKKEKKDKKRKAAEKNGADGNGDGDGNGDVPGEAPPKKREKTHSAKDISKKTASMSSRLSGINNPMTASLTAKVLAEQDKLQRSRRLAETR